MVVADPSEYDHVAQASSGGRSHTSEQGRDRRRSTASRSCSTPSDSPSSQMAGSRPVELIGVVTEPGVSERLGRKASIVAAPVRVR